MAIERIDPSRCTGCGICVENCTADIIHMDAESGKAFVKYPEDCAMCCWCVAECPQKAIEITAERHSPLFNSWG